MRKPIEKILSSKWLFRFLVTIPLLFIIFRIISFQVSANPLEDLLLFLGTSAFYILLITLWITPLIRIIPSKIPIRYLNIHKRTLGVSVFFYVCLHLVVYYLDQGDTLTFIKSFQKPFVIIGFSAFLILLILASTSFNFVVKKMKKKNWKKLHRLVYLTIPLLFFHITAKDKGDYGRAVIFLFPLAIAEIIRFVYYLKSLKLKKN